MLVVVVVGISEHLPEPFVPADAAANGGQLLQWQKTSAFGRSYHFALIFDGNGLCGGITHQFVR